MASQIGSSLVAHSRVALSVGSAPARGTRWGAAALIRCALIIALACGGLVAAARPQDASAQTTAPTAAETARAVRTVEAAFGLIMDRYVQPQDPAGLLDAAWRSAQQAAGLPVPDGDDAVTFSGDRAAALAEFRTWFDTLITHTGGDPRELSRAAVRGMARSLDDCHTSFAASYEHELSSFAGSEQYGGVGATALSPTLFDPPAPGAVFVSLVEGGPAEQAGLHLGDALLMVDGQDVTTWTSAQLVPMIRGIPGTVVELTVDRPGAPEPVTVAIERAVVTLPLVRARLLPSAIPGGAPVGYIHLYTFVQPAVDAFAMAVTSLHEQGAQTWVIDLRDNAGGDVRAFTSIASMFVKSGVLGVTADRGGTVQTFDADGTSYREFLRPVAVLTNSYSASASELLSADLQEYGIARLFGGTTAGCFGNSQLFRLPDESALWLTVRSLKSGLLQRDVHKVGVEPDEAVVRTRDDLAAAYDPQLAQALQWLQMAPVQGAPAPTSTSVPVAPPTSTVTPSTTPPPSPTPTAVPGTPGAGTPSRTPAATATPAAPASTTPVKSPTSAPPAASTTPTLTPAARTGR